MSAVSGVRDAAAELPTVSLAACIDVVSASSDDTGVPKWSGAPSIDISLALLVQAASSFCSLAKLSTVSTDGKGRGLLWSTGE